MLKAIIDHLQKFMMELGKGYAFIGRQVRIHTEKEEYFIDLVFFNYILNCFVLIDLKTKKITINFNLIFAPIEDIEYVIIHELCHCAVRNHSKVFYSYQQMFCPEYKARKADLNKNIHPFVVKIEAINSTI